MICNPAVLYPKKCMHLLRYGTVQIKLNVGDNDQVELDLNLKV